MRPRSGTPLSKAEFEALAGFRYALRRFFRFSEVAARDVGLTPQKYQALLAIKGHPGSDHVSIRELSESLMIRHHSAVGLVDRLEEQDLVERVSDSHDRRQVNVGLTAHGEDLLHRLAATHRAEWLHLRPELMELLQHIDPLPHAEGAPREEKLNG